MTSCFTRIVSFSFWEPFAPVFHSDSKQMFPEVISIFSICLLPHIEMTVLNEINPEEVIRKVDRKGEALDRRATTKRFIQSGPITGTPTKNRGPRAPLLWVWMGIIHSSVWLLEPTFRVGLHFDIKSYVDDVHLATAQRMNKGFGGRGAWTYQTQRNKWNHSLAKLIILYREN